MREKEQHIQEEPEHKWRPRDGFTPSYRAFHEVYITKDLGTERNNQLVPFINQHIIEFKGKTVDKHGIPQMLFERSKDAQEFANELHLKLKIPKEHISIKARKFTR
jgi:hypothetical protein